MFQTLFAGPVAGLTAASLGAALAAALAAAPALAQDADAGAKVFKRCAVCHKIGEDAENSTGPSLEGVVGRTAGTAEGFGYSEAMVAAGESGLVWDAAALDAFLADPKGKVPGNAMAFAGVRKPEDRADVIAYIEAN